MTGQVEKTSDEPVAYGSYNDVGDVAFDPEFSVNLDDDGSVLSGTVEGLMEHLICDSSG